MADSLLPDDLQDDTADRAAIIAKWKDKPREELENAKAESDLYIKTLTARLDDLKNDYLTLREQHQASAQLKDMIEKLEKSGHQSSHDTNREDVQQPQVKLEDIEALVQQKLTDHQKSQIQTQNFRNVQAKLKEHFGDNYQSVYVQRLDALGLSKEFADDLAKNHPSVFLKTFEIDGSRQNSSFQAPPHSSQRPSSFAPKTVKRDWNYYQEMKKNDPRMYLDPKIAVQMHDDALALGDEFGMPD